MTIRAKLQLLIIATVLALGGSIAVTVNGFDRVNAAHEASHRRDVQVRGLTEMKASAFATIELDPTSEDTKHIFADSEQNFRHWTDVITPLFASHEQQASMQALVGRWNDYIRKSHANFELALSDPRAANDQLGQLYRNVFQPMQADLEALDTEAARRGDLALQESERISRQTTLMIGGVLAGVLIVVVGWIALLSRSIQRAVAGIQRTLQDASASLDLAQRAPVRGRDEIDQTAQAFNHLMTRIGEVMATVRDSAASVSSATQQIAAGNVDLSSRTEEQAASLEETAASMEELTGTVRQNADHARRAAGLAGDASQIAARGNEVVSQVVGTMNEITTSSAKIADIIGMIEGIAFQTNILALNAAVEAARAGEQGRGFAVVAGEVRALAQRCATAAKEIKELIDTSVTQVGSGSALVGQAGATMQEIIGAVSRVTQIMNEIALASDQQSQGIDQIGQAVTQMDDVTQQNAALVEQAAAAAQSLQDQSGRLHEAVSAFKL